MHTMFSGITVAYSGVPTVLSKVSMCALKIARTVRPVGVCPVHDYTINEKSRDDNQFKAHLQGTPGAKESQPIHGPGLSR